MNAEEFNLRCAEYMGVDWTGASYPVVSPQDWQYYTDANLRNKVIEKMRIDTFALTTSMEWTCFTNNTSKSQATEKSMEAAQIACITKVLEAL